MNQASIPALLDKSKALTLIKTASEDTAIIVDFDETLLLRNSTAEYLDSLRPRWVGLLLLKSLYVVRPWSWLPIPYQSSQIQDWFLVTISTILLPWTWFLWQRRAKHLAERYKNQKLLTAIAENNRSSIIVATLGFNFIVNPILKALPITCDRVVGCRFWQGIKDRGEGKLLMLNKVLAPEEIRSAIAITDSADDLPLLQKVAKPCLITWSAAKYVSPLNNIYLPFSYVEKVKRFGEKYTFKVIFWDDLPVLLLAFSWQASRPLIHGTSIILLLISFWCVYELGYHENDFVAETYEENPKLSAKYYDSKEMMNSRSPWFWSVTFGFLGTACMSEARGVSLLFNHQLISASLESLNPNLLPFSYWLIFLLTTRFCFWVYNYLNKPARSWLYILLQSLRYYGFLALTTINFIGTSLLASQILSRTMLYIVYRYTASRTNDWPKLVPEKLLRWLVFIFILSAIAVGAKDLSLWKNWQTWAIMAWCFIQGHRQIFRIIAQFRPITVQDRK